MSKCSILNWPSTDGPNSPHTRSSEGHIDARRNFSLRLATRLPPTWKKRRKTRLAVPPNTKRHIAELTPPVDCATSMGPFQGRAALHRCDSVPRPPEAGHTLDKGIWLRPPQAQPGPPDPGSETSAGATRYRAAMPVARYGAVGTAQPFGAPHLENRRGWQDHQIGRTAPPGMISRDADHTPVLVTADGGQGVGWTKGTPQDRSRVVPLKGSRLRLLATHQAPTNHALAS